jgi:GTP-binding protein YchF
MVDIGIIGLARSGKTSLFNAMTRGTAAIGAYSSKSEPNVGVVRVPDARVDALAALYHPKKTTYAEVQFVDYPVSGFGAEGPAAKYLAELAGMDALVHVVRAFEDDAVPHPDQTVDPNRDAEALDLELTFADLALIERRLTRIEAEMRSVRAADRAPLDRDRTLMERLKAALEAGEAILALALSEEESRALATYQFVTRRPVLLVVNLGESQLADAEAIEREFALKHGGPGVGVVALCAKIEAELATMEPADAIEFRRDLGLPEVSPLGRAIREAYALLDLQSFLTAGEDECRAWTVRRGTSAPEAAGKIHSDLEKGFIRAEVARWDELVEAGSIAELKKRGRLHVEGKTYTVQDGDVVNVLFNL